MAKEKRLAVNPHEANITLFYGNSTAFFNSLCENSNFLHDEQPVGHPGPPKACGLPADQQSHSSSQGWPGSVPCCRWRQKERCCVENFRAARLRCAWGATGRLSLSTDGNRRGRSRDRGSRQCESCSPGSPRLTPGPPVQGHCSMLTMADGDDNCGNKPGCTHTLTAYSAFLGVLLMKPWTAVVFADQGHLGRHPTETLFHGVATMQKPKPNHAAGGWGGQYRAAKINKILKFVITSPASCNNCSSPNSLPISHAACSTRGWKGNAAVPVRGPATDRPAGRAGSTDGAWWDTGALRLFPTSPFHSANFYASVPGQMRYAKVSLWPELFLLRTAEMHFHISFTATNVSRLFCKIILVRMALFAAYKISLIFFSKGVLPEASPTQPKL